MAWKITAKSKWASAEVATQLKALTSEVCSISELLRQLGYATHGGSRAYAVAALKYHNIDHSHFRKTGNRYRALELKDVLVEECPTNRHVVKRLLLKHGVLKNECSICDLGGEWNGKPITMRLDHINGIHDDNRRENLRMVCPNCDSQLSTYAGRNSGKPKII